MGRDERPWTDDEVESLLDMRERGATLNEIGKSLGRTHDSVRGKLLRVPNAKRDRQRTSPVDRIVRDAQNPPIDTNDKETIRRLESDNARLREQLTWSQHAKSETRTGGVLTIRVSDVHHGDEGHLLSCYASVEEKLLVLIKQYEPQRIQYIGFDDWIAGRGIFKEQDLSMAVSDVGHQIAIGAFKARRFFGRVREVSGAPIDIHCLRGNHDYVGGTSMASSLFYETRTACEDVPGISWKMHWDRTVINLAAAGLYNVLVYHGFGYSKISPNSPAFIDAVKDALLGMQRNMQPEEQIRRVLSGHTHYLSVGLERNNGLFWDTTGGFQRNSRVKLGMNQRPIGAIVYASPEGMESDILRPLEVKPDGETLEREIGDPHLGAANRKDCGECLESYGKMLTGRGLLAEGTVFGLAQEGRW